MLSPVNLWPRDAAAAWSTRADDPLVYFFQVVSSLSFASELVKTEESSVKKKKKNFSKFVDQLHD